MNHKKIQFMIRHWRLVVHLLLKTQKFGVNNQWIAKHPSALAWSFQERVIGILKVTPILNNYRCLVMRSYSGWISKNQADDVFKGFK